MMKTPLSEPCIFGKADVTSGYNTPNPNLIISFFESGQYFAIYASKTANGIFKWKFSGYSFKGMEINDANFNVRDFFALFFNILISFYFRFM